MSVLRLASKYRISNVCVYINSSCNLQCSYCNSHIIDKYLKGKVLSFEVFKRRFKSLINNNFILPVTFYGGEPLLHRDLLVKCIGYLIENGFQPGEVSVFTNATLIDDKFSDFIRKTKINLIVSLDGIKKCNDQCRIFKNSDKSVYDSVIANIKKYNLEKSVNINMVVNPQNVVYFSENIFHIFSLGFRNINLDIDCQSEWSENDIKKLSESIDLFFEKYRDFYEKFPDFIISNLKNTERREKRGLNLALMNDGRFYLCDIYSAVKYALSGRDTKYYMNMYKKTLKKYNFNLNPNEFFCGFGSFTLYTLEGKKPDEIFEKFLKYSQIRDFFSRKIGQKSFYLIK